MNKNVDKKIKKTIEKLNHLMKKSEENIYEWTFFSKHVVLGSYKYFEVYAEVTKVIKEEFNEDCTIHNLGSRVMGVGDDKESDLDIFIDIGNANYYKDRDYDNDCVVIKKLKATLERRKNQWDVKHLNIKNPSFKAIHKSTGIKCDISVTNGISVENSKLFGHLFAIQTEAIAFHHFIKRWLAIFDVEALRGFSLTLLIVFFLQQNNLMPSIRKIQKGLRKVFIDNFEVQFDATRTLNDYKIDEMRSYKHWLQPFFKFYSNDFYRNTIICTYSGRLFEKDHYPVNINTNYPMTIPAPLLRHSNVAKNVKNLDIAAFCQACEFSLKYFDEYKIKSEFPPFYKFDPHEPKITNIEQYLKHIR